MTRSLRFKKIISNMLNIKTKKCLKMVTFGGHKNQKCRLSFLFLKFKKIFES